MVLQDSLWYVSDQLGPIFSALFTLGNIASVNARIAEVIEDHIRMRCLLDNDVRSLLYNVFKPYLHLFDSFGVDSVFAVHVA